MHFPIVQLSPQPIEPDNQIDMYSVCEDEVINYYSDWVGDNYNESDRRDCINNLLKPLFDGIADIDVNNNTIIFKSEKEICETLHNLRGEAIARLQRQQALKDETFFEFRHTGNWLRDFQVMFWWNGGGWTSGYFADEMKYLAGQTFYIGSIIDAHY